MLLIKLTPVSVSLVVYMREFIKWMGVYPSYKINNNSKPNHEPVPPGDT